MGQENGKGLGKKEANVTDNANQLYERSDEDEKLLRWNPLDAIVDGVRMY